MDAAADHLLKSLKAEAAGPQVFQGIDPIPRPVAPTSRSARVRGRWQRALELWEVAERTRLVLNETGATGFSAEVDTPSAESPTGRRGWAWGQRRAEALASVPEAVALQLRWQGRLLQSAKGMLEARRAFALTGVTTDEYLKRYAADEYQKEEGLPTPYVPVLAEAVAEPEVGEATVEMDSALQGTQGEFLLQAESALIPEPERGQVLGRQNAMYNRVLGPRSEYVKYLHRPVCRELWDLQPATKAKATCSFATVYKRNGNRAT